MLSRILRPPSCALFPVLLSLLLVAALALPTTVRGQGLQVGGGYTHVTGNSEPMALMFAVRGISQSEYVAQACSILTRRVV
jgi:hypothetical protein